MRIAIDARTLTAAKTGDRTVTRGLLYGLAANDCAGAHEYLALTERPLPAGALPQGGRVREVSAPRPGGVLWMPLAFPRLLRREQADVALFHYMGPFSAPCPLVTIVHDVVWRALPHTFPRRDRLVMDTFLPGTLRRAAAVIAVSEFTKSEIVRWFDIPPERIHVVPNAVDEGFAPVTDPQALAAVRSRYHLPERFILSVGVLQPRKNIEGLMQAYAMLPADLRREVGLVITGKRGWLDKHLPALARETAEGIVFTGYVDDGELPALYSLADCMAYPSLYEGFGLPPVEAMACATPVVTSRAASLPEVTAGAALLVDPADTQELAAALEQVLTDRAVAEECISRGLARVRSLTWQASAQRLMEVLCTVTGKGR